ncbi:hypothetical protein GGX14DRAFT_172510 [Mycena pura]|uniref:Uncharacterized protein n=1 Tax=Mycena pura TaxID=153505 RepID=A0AAD6Y515_9AGAR|nr:hypothetical protein GGX14DRAFT_172510 [Mycena pura]
MEPRYSTAGFSDEQRAVLAVAEKLLNCIYTRDKAQMLSLILPGGGATLLRNGTPLHLSFPEVVEGLPFDDPREMAGPISGQPVVLVDRDIAMAWTPYEFKVDGWLDHIGTDIWFRKAGWALAYQRVGRQ